MSSQEPVPPLSEAIELYQRGRTFEAEQVILAGAHAACEEYGQDSPEYASSLFDLSSFYTMQQDFGKAVEAMEAASEVKVPGEQGQRDRLTYLMNLGELLVRAGDLPRAESVLRSSLSERLEFYGCDHAGYAYGLESLAEVLWLKGDTEEALSIIQEATEIFMLSENQRLFHALALRAYVQKERYPSKNVFQDLNLPEEYISELAGFVLDRSGLPEPALALSVLKELEKWLDGRLEDDAPMWVSVYTAISNIARDVQDHATRITALQEIASRSKRHIPQLIEAECAAALAQSEAGLTHEAEMSYCKALQDAEKSGDLLMVTKVLRNFGLFLSELGRTEEAERMIRRALAEAEKADAPEARARSLIALGILIQHEGKLEQAAPLLEEALQILPPTHPDMLYGRNHLFAIVNGGSCGCGDMNQSLAATICEMISPHLPPDLIEGLSVDGEFNIDVRLKREPSEEEQDLLNHVIHHAVQELRRTINRMY